MIRLFFALTLAMHATLVPAQTTLRVANWLPPVHPIVADMVVPWGEAVAEATEGRVRVEIMQASLGKPPAHFDIARDGIADVTFGVHGYTPGRFVLTQIAELPFLGASAEALSVAYWRTHQAMLAEADEHQGVHVLGVFTHGPGHIFNTQRDIDSLESAAGLKMRVGGGIVNQVAQRLGMVPVQAPSTQTYELLSNGVADGILFPAESVPFFKLDEVLTMGTLIPEGLYNTSFFLVMNQGVWEGLSEEDQAALMSVSGEAFAVLAGRAWDAADARGMEAMTAAGLKIHTADQAFLGAIREALAPVATAWIAQATEQGVDGAAALEMLRAEVVGYQP